MPVALPIDDVLGDLAAALRDHDRALLIAPPGAGKTTRVAPALLDEDWCAGEILLLVPRRLAARAAGDYMARERGEKPGQTIGYTTRLDSKPGKRITVMTHGVFLARIQKDPDLPGVSAVLFDEVHERSLDNDLALAFAIEAQDGLREDLRILAMSATLDGASFARLLGNPPTIESAGKSFPLALDHIGRDPDRHLEPQMASAIRNALDQHEGSLLAFLPGVREIERTADALGELPDDIVLHRLHGQVDPARQRAALAPPEPGMRKLVLASAIAETSVTVDGVRIVVDSGLSRRPRYDRAAGLTRLVTERASQAAATQRAGRAARQAPGVAIRLWEEAATPSMPAHDPPEIVEADLSRLLLASLQWGEADPARLPFLDPPSKAALDEARRRLEQMGAISDDAITEHGRAMAAIPLEPRLAHMLIAADDQGLRPTAAVAAALLTERGVGGRSEDLEQRYRRWSGERGKRADAARRMAQRWGGKGRVEPDRLGEAVALAFPDRVARRRDRTGEAWASTGGRGFHLDPASPLASAQWLAIAEVAGAASGARILSAAAIDEARIEHLFADRIKPFSEVRYDSASKAISATRGKRLGALTLSSSPDPNPDDEAVLRGLLDAVQREGLDILPWNARGKALRTRAQYARTGDASLPDLSDSALLEGLGDWLGPLLLSQRRLDRIDPAGLTQSLETMAGYDALRRIDAAAPARFESPAGTTHAIDYSAPGGPTVEVRAQALYGLSTHPTVGAVPLVLSITSPAGRPIQTTTDLPAFWSGSWDDVAKDMRGRYPKHDWPVDPTKARADLRTKKRRQS